MTPVPAFDVNETLLDLAALDRAWLTEGRRFEHVHADVDATVWP